MPALTSTSTSIYVKVTPILSEMLQTLAFKHDFCWTYGWRSSVHIDVNDNCKYLRFINKNHVKYDENYIFGCSTIPNPESAVSFEEAIDFITKNMDPYTDKVIDDIIVLDFNKKICYQYMSGDTAISKRASVSFREAKNIYIEAETQDNVFNIDNHYTYNLLIKMRTTHISVGCLKDIPMSTAKKVYDSIVEFETIH